MSQRDATVLSFAIQDRWIVTVESERRSVKVCHRTRWYLVARRTGHEDRRHWCASRADAPVIAKWQREAFDLTAEYEQFEAAYNRPTEAQRARIDAIAEALWGRK